LQPGARIVVAVLNSPPFSNDGERTLEHLAEVCQTNAVRVLVLDVAEGAKSAPNAALNALATKTGGAWLRQAKALEPNVATVVTMTSEPAEPAPAPSLGLRFRYTFGSSAPREADRWAAACSTTKRISAKPRLSSPPAALPRWVPAPPRWPMKPTTPTHPCKVR